MKENQKMYSITFLRHGESVGNADGYFQGQSDFPLNQKGINQVHSLVERWKEEKIDIDLIIASPLSWARQTAEMIAASFQVPLEMDEVWMERDNGYLAGLTHEEGRRKYPQPEFSNIYQSFAVTGEGDWELFLRAGRGLQTLLKKEPGNYLVVSHGGLLNLVMYSILGISPQGNYSGSQVSVCEYRICQVLLLPW